MLQIENTHETWLKVDVPILVHQFKWQLSVCCYCLVDSELCFLQKSPKQLGCYSQRDREKDSQREMESEETRRTEYYVSENNNQSNITCFMVNQISLKNNWSSLVLTAGNKNIDDNCYKFLMGFTAMDTFNLSFC